MAKPPSHGVTSDGRTDGPTHDEPEPGSGGRSTRRLGRRARRAYEHVHNKKRPPGAPASANRGRKVISPAQPVAGGQHQVPGLSAQARPTLGPPSSKDRATRAGTHPQPEAVGLRAPTVVRLEGALAHSRLQGVKVCWCRRPPPEASVVIYSRRHAAAAANDSAELRYVAAGATVKPTRASPRPLPAAVVGLRPRPRDLPRGSPPRSSSGNPTVPAAIRRRHRARQDDLSRSPRRRPPHGAIATPPEGSDRPSLCTTA